MRTRAFPAVCIAIVGFVVLGCTGSLIQPGPRVSYLDGVLKAGELRVATSADLPPLSMRNKGGELMGLEIDLARALGDAMGIEVRFVERRFNELLPMLERGEVDLVISGLTITPERNARFAFAGPYFISGTSILSKSDEIAYVSDPSALDDAGRVYVALDGSTSAKLVEDHMPKAKLVAAVDYETGVQMVIDDKADALVADFQVCNLARWRNPDADLHTMMTPFTTEPLGIALPPQAPLLLNLVSNYLNTLESTGALAQLKAKWLTNGSWVGELP